jgi:putative phosphoribosyl transferase
VSRLRKLKTETTIPIDGAALEATIAVRAQASGIIVFAHGSGSGRASPRNRFVAEQLADAGFGVLLLDLLTASEERYDRETAELRLDVGRLAVRLVRAIDWLDEREPTAGIPVGCYGASTGAAAALIAAAERPDRVFAVVSRGGRPDLAKGELEKVRAPTLLIVVRSARPRPQHRGCGPDARPGDHRGRRPRGPPVRGARGPGARRRADRGVVRAAPRKGRPWGWRGALTGPAAQSAIGLRFPPERSGYAGDMSDDEIRDSSGSVDPKRAKERESLKRAELDRKGEKRSDDQPRPLAERPGDPPRPRR